MTTLAANLASALLAAIWQGTLLALATGLLLRLLPAIPAAVRSLVWTATFAAIVLLHLAPVHSAGAPATTHALEISPNFSLAIALVWLALSSLRAVQFLAAARHLAHIARRATPIPAPEGFAGDCTLCTSEDVDRPSVLGFFRPRILLPPALLATLTPAELHQILLHETEHLRRSDAWSNLFQKLALVLFPLNPALAWVERRLCLERELACDDRVLEATGTPKAYATCLTHLAEHSMLHRGIALALGILGTRPAAKSEISTRVHRILSRPTPALAPSRTRFAAAALLAAILTASATLARAPRLIGFASLASAAPAHAAPLAATVAAAPTSTPHATLVKASLPTKRRFAHRRAPNVFVANWRTQQPRVTLTISRDAAAPEQFQPFAVPTVAYVVPAYAAVRVPNGWIIIQL